MFKINTRLRTINLDRNGISVQGYTDITYALQSNYSMRHIPFPTFDLQSVIKTHPERVDTIIHRMQELLQGENYPEIQRSPLGPHRRSLYNQLENARFAGIF